MQLYSQQSMDEYYRKVQEKDFYNQRMMAYANEHTVGRAQNDKMEERYYQLEKPRAQFTADEQRIIDQYEKETLRK